MPGGSAKGGGGNRQSAEHQQVGVLRLAQRGQQAAETNITVSDP
jgi:hypothetical protein